MRERWRRSWDKARVPRRSKRRLGSSGGPSGPAGRWRRFIAAVQDLGELAKLTALFLALAGVIAIYFPEARQAYERRTMPSAWYNIVLLSDPWSEPYPFMAARPRGYESPAWSDGLNVELLYGLAGQMIYSSDVAVGRKAAGAMAPVTYIYGENVCLEVSALRFSVTRPRDGLEIPRVAPIDRDQLGGSGLDAHRSLLARLPKSLTQMPKELCIGESEADKLRKKDEPLPRPVCPRISVWAKAKKISC